MAQSHTGVSPWLAEVDVEMRDAGGASPAGTSGVGLSLSPEEAQAVLSQAQNALAKLQQLQRQTEALKQVQPAADDPASLAYNARLVNSQGVFCLAGDHVSSEATHLNALVEKIQESFRMINGRDSAAAHDIGQTGTPKGGVAG
ncbi:hypothetical protein ACGFMK_40995 [Amycolatopsis sp. NPDC049252]|uniref:hypothetical protein n=1 Tax=Amycolatopsis sp. NPDC049252 TaxID=3363933 RepID=UPI0037195952